MSPPSLRQAAVRQISDTPLLPQPEGVGGGHLCLSESKLPTRSQAVGFESQGAAVAGTPARSLLGGPQQPAASNWFREHKLARQARTPAPLTKLLVLLC